MNKEGYSKEAYANAENESDVARGKFYEAQESNPGYSKANKLLMEEAIKTKQRMQMLYENGETEAIALNEEYGRLVAQALETQTPETLKAVEDFKKEKLNIPEEDRF